MQADEDMCESDSEDEETVLTDAPLVSQHGKSVSDSEQDQGVVGTGAPSQSYNWL